MTSNRSTTSARASRNFRRVALGEVGRNLNLDHAIGHWQEAALGDDEGHAPVGEQLGRGGVGQVVLRVRVVVVNLHSHVRLGHGSKLSRPRCAGATVVPRLFNDRRPSLTGRPTTPLELIGVGPSDLRHREDVTPFRQVFAAHDVERELSPRLASAEGDWFVVP
jgi:hypothetical protein